ncbi:porin [Vibrio algarum]|uniref:Porin n=1 Tax=Vibrio algarum TaxID=3020714 RepID=A0ABT4YX52_9VIBR|nr:porin [Vibrio sp. KJ40-1]MDB1126162.1 porin [Vibrio sp. KJ40-1]
MKQITLIATSITALVSGSSFAATVYQSDDTELMIGGRAEARFNISDNNKSSSTSSFNDISRARVNVVGKTKITESLDGFGKYEAEFNTSDSSTINNRYVFAGVSSKAGDFSYGKQDSAQVMLTDITDTMATFGADAADLTDGNKDKRDANFLYAGQFGDVVVKANYLAAQKSDDSDQSIGVAALYSFDSYDVGAGFVSTDDDRQFNLAGNVKISDFTFGAFLAFGKASDDDATAFELSAKYTFGKADFIAVYNKSDYDASSKKSDEAENIAIEGVYKFTTNLRTYAGYKFEQIDSLDNQFQAGIRYDF